MGDERAELADQIERAIANKLRMWAINVEVTDETVVLQGGVRTSQEYHQAMDVAHELAGDLCGNGRVALGSLVLPLEALLFRVAGIGQRLLDAIANGVERGVLDDRGARH